MSRTYRTNRRTFKKVHEKDSVYQCKCSWCINMKYRDRKGLSIKESLKLS